ncbi:MAG: hypothetical protein D6738_15595 [Acidobacteria bacterium]|nr:MAG: hypothetical protein D6738_15595 [Acidobacteriota bacterium]
MKPSSAFRSVCLVLSVALALGSLPPASARERDRMSRREIRETMRFATEMASRGLWREALYRWKKVLAVRPNDPRLLNNIAVAEEALGLVDDARRHYARALELGGDRIEQIRANADLFESRFADSREQEATAPQDPSPAARPGESGDSG